MEIKNLPEVSNLKISQVRCCALALDKSAKAQQRTFFNFQVWKYCQM